MKFLAIAAALSGLVGVVLGAFGAHALQSLVTPDRLEVWKTAVNYQMYHAPVLLLIARMTGSAVEKYLVLAGWSMLSGIIIFSGSLYLLVYLNMPKLGMVTPLGGSLLILGWLFLLVFTVKNQHIRDGK